MYRILLLVPMSLFLGCEKPALHALEDRIAALEELGGGSDDDLATQVEDLNTDLESTTDDLADLTAEVTTLEETVTTQNNQITTLEDALTTQNDQITTLEDALTTQNDQITTVEESVTNLEAQDLAEVGNVVGLMSETIPTGFLLCDGSSVLQADYPDLYAVIGEQFGTDDPTTSFNLPDLRGEFLRGWDGGAGLDPDAADRDDRGDGTTGDAVGTGQDAGVGSGNYSLSSTSALVNGTCSPFQCGLTVVTSVSLADNGGTSAETRPTNVSVVWVIKY
jgi:microcystin-dependent protein